MIALGSGGSDTGNADSVSAATRTAHARGAGWRLTFRHDTQAFANASATWSSASYGRAAITVTARRQGSQLAWKNSVNSVSALLLTSL